MAWWSSPYAAYAQHNRVSVVAGRLRKRFIADETSPRLASPIASIERFHTIRSVIKPAVSPEALLMSAFSALFYFSFHCSASRI